MNDTDSPEVKDASVLFEGAGGSSPITKGLLTGEFASEGYRRLSLVAGVMFGAALVLLIVWLLEGAASGVWGASVEFGSVFLLLLILLCFLVGCRRQGFPVRAFVPIALSMEVLCSIIVSASILGWQHRIGPETLAWLTNDGPQPFDLGAGHIPWSGFWVVLFATLIPLRPRQHLLGALLSISPLFFGPMISIWFLGYPPELEVGRLGPVLHVSVWLGFRGLLAAGIAYFAARSVHGLRKRLAKARRMGSYFLQEKLGEGGMGEVWKANHHMLARPAAIKLIKPANGSQPSTWPDLAARFQREVSATAQLRSPRTIEIYDYGLTDDGTFYYVMELLDGLDLEALVKTHGPVSWTRAVHILVQICHSIGEAHDRGLVHRDIKPANIFLCRLGRDVDQVKVLDFGLVKKTGSQTEDSGLTQRGVLVGTPAYAAPEVATGIAAADARSDIYSLGCVAFWLLTARTVFEASSSLEMLIQHAKEDPSPPSHGSELEIPQEVDQLVLVCLSKEPHDRPSSVDDLAGCLRAIDEPEGWSKDDAARWWRIHLPKVVEPVRDVGGGDRVS
jgi:hypothetical protein